MLHYFENASVEVLDLKRLCNASFNVDIEKQLVNMRWHMLFS
jgi:hypothetical protein